MDKKTYYSLKEARTGLVLAKAEKLNGVAKTKIKTPTIFELMDDYRKNYISTNNEKTTAYGYSIIENTILSLSFRLADKAITKRHESKHYQKAQ